jgi:hypothetical protein
LSPVELGGEVRAWSQRKGLKVQLYPVELTGNYLQDPAGMGGLVFPAAAPQMLQGIPFGEGFFLQIPHEGPDEGILRHFGSIFPKVPVAALQFEAGR